MGYIRTSAFLAYLWSEPGAELVKQSLADCAAMSAVNFAEVFSRMSDFGQDVDEVVRRLAQRGLIGGALLILPFDERQAHEIARLRRQTRASGLCLGDRACLAQGQVLELPAPTADRLWQSLELGIQVRAIRQRTGAALSEHTSRLECYDSLHPRARWNAADCGSLPPAADRRGR